MRIPPSGWSAVPSPNNHRSPIAFADETDADFDQPTSRRTNAASTQTEVATAGATGPSPKVRSARREAKIATACVGTEISSAATGTGLFTGATGTEGAAGPPANPESADPGPRAAPRRGPVAPRTDVLAAAEGRSEAVSREPAEGDLPDRVALGPAVGFSADPDRDDVPESELDDAEPEPVSSADATPCTAANAAPTPTATAQSRPRPWRCRPDGPLAAPMLNRSKRARTQSAAGQLFPPATAGGRGPSR